MYLTKIGFLCDFTHYFMYLRTLFPESVHRSQQSARGTKTQEKVKNSNSLLFFAVFVWKCFPLTFVYRRLFFFWILNSRLPIIFVQHIEYIYPLSFDFQYCYWEVTVSLTVSTSNIFFFLTAFKIFLSFFTFSVMDLYVFSSFVCFSSWSYSLLSFNGSGKTLKTIFKFCLCSIISFLSGTFSLYALCLSLFLLYFTSFCLHLHYLVIFFWSMPQVWLFPQL